MAEYTVFDIKGKGFKYEQYAQEQENAPPPTGTFGCFIGTSNWGPINTPYTVTGGSLEFKNAFGYAGTKVDHGWDAANLHFRANSALGIFTRLADENIATRANLLLKDKSDKPAIINGKTNILNGVFIDDTNDSLGFELVYKIQPTEQPRPIDVLVNLQSLRSAKASLTSKIVNQNTPVSIDSKTVIKVTVKQNNTIRIFTKTSSVTNPTNLTNTEDFADFISNPTYNGAMTVVDGNGTSSNDLLSTYLNFTDDNNRLKIEATSTDIIFKIEDSTGTFLKKLYNSPTRTAYYDILNAINLAVNTAIEDDSSLPTLPTYKFADVDNNGHLVLTGINADSTSYIELRISGGTSDETERYQATILSLLGFTSDELEDENSGIGYSDGVIGTNIGTFRARYRGVEGNTIKVKFETTSSGADSQNNLYILFRSNLISTINDYNLDINSDNFLGTLIDNDAVASTILKYDHGKRYYDFNDSDDLTAEAYDLLDSNGNLISQISNFTIDEGTYSLDGGDSGETSNELSFNVLTIIEQLKNIDLYQIDFIAVPGYEEESVQNALIDLCAFRQDCFAFIDMPLITGTSTRDAVNKAVRYINGNYIRTEKIDSIYGVLAFPYVRFRKRFYNAQNILASEISLVSPTTILPYLYTLRDITAGNTFDIAAGESYGGRILLGTADFTGLQFILNQADRDLLYADSFDACINPISFNTEAGFFLDGQKTTLRKNLNGKLTSLSRISVMRTGLFIKKISYRISRQYFFAPIDPTTWEDFSNRLTREIMQVLVTARMIEPNYIVKCDSVTNTAQVRNANGMVAYLEFTPYKKLERIKIIANITETDTTVALT
jgi:hypothetical protein